MLKMEADTVHQMEDQNIDTDVRDEIGIENDKESEPDENKANGAIEEKSIIRDGEIDKTVKSADESRIPDRERTVENGECGERKESEAENDVMDQGIGGKEKHLADNDSGTGTSISDKKTHELDENGIEEDGQIEDSKSKDVEDAIDEMDGDGVIQDKTCIGKEPLTDPEIEKVISEDKLTETVKENENETEKVDVNIDNDNITDEDVVQIETDSVDMVTGQEVLVDTETSTDTKYVDDTRTMEQEENPPDDKSVDKDTPDRDNSVEVDQINDLADEITAEEDEAENEEQEFAVESEVAQTETTDTADKDSSSELVCQKVQIADECSNDVNSESIKEKSESKKIDECLEDKTETDVSESPSEQTEMQVDTVPKTSEMLDEPIDDEDNAFEAGLESAKKESSKKSDPENEDEKHPEASHLVESGSVGENEMNTSIDSIEDKPPERTASLDTDTLENENQTENQKENNDDEQNSRVADQGEEAHDESDLEKTEAVADIESEKSGGSEEDITGKIGDIAEKESERPKLYQASNENEDKGVVDDLLVEASNTDNDQEQTMDVTEEETDLTRTASEDIMNHTDGTQASDIIDRHEDIQDELKVTDNLSAEASNNKAEVTDNLSAQASNENEDKGVVDDLLVEASNTDNDQEQTMDVTEEETDLTRTASEDIMNHTDGTQASDIIDRHEDIQDELKVTDNLSAEASNNKAEVTDNLSAQASNENEDKGVVDDLLVEASNTDNDQEQTMDVTEEETDLTRTASEDIMDSEFKVTGGMSIPIDDESKDAEAEVPVNQDLEVEVNNIGDGQEETMKVTEETDVSGTASENISKSNPTHLLAVGKCLEKFRVSDQLCDFTIKVKDTNFRVHKLILCAASPTLLDLITPKNRAVTEMTVSSDVNPTAVEAFLHYIYTGELKLDKSDLAGVEKLVSEYCVDSLRAVLDKDCDLSKSVQTQTEAKADKVDLVKHKTKQPVSVQELGKHDSKDEKTANNDKSLTQKIVPEEDDRMLESDDDENADIDMDYGASIDNDDDLLNDSPIDSGVVNTPSTSVHKAKDQILVKTSSQTSKDSAKQSSSAKYPVKTEPRVYEQKTVQQNESKVSPRVRFPNIAAGLQAIKEARLMREKGLNKTSGENKDRQNTVGGTQNETRQNTVGSTQNETSTPNTPDKNLKVRVEKLPPNINRNVRVVVNDENDDLKDSDIEFVAEKSDKVETSVVSHTKREFTLEEKEQIALEAKRYGTAQTSTSRGVPLPDILSWMTFFGLRKVNDNVSKKYGKQVNHEAELSIVRWIVQQQEIHGNVNLDAMRNYALAIYRQSQPNFVASKTWLGNFFKRNISVLQGTSFVHGGEEDNENQSEPVPVKLTHLPLLVDPALASIESQISKHESNMSRRSATQDDDMDVTEAEYTTEPMDDNVNTEELPSSSTNAIDSLISDAQLAESSNFDNEIAQYSADIAENLGLNLKNVTNFDSLGCIDNSVKLKPSEPVGSGLGGISKELLAKIKSKPVVIGSAVTFDAKTERRLAEWLIEKQEEDGYVYRDDFIAYARTLKKGRKSFRGTPGWIQLFMRRNSVKMPLLKQVVLKSKFKTYYSDQEKVAIVQQARMLGVPHVAKMLRINSGVIHSWKVGMDAEERKKGGPKNFEKVTRSVTRAFPSVSKEVDDRIDNSLKEQIKARIDVETRRKSSANANRGPDPELESEAIAKIKEAEIVRYQDVQKICFEVYSKKRPDFQASKSWVLKFVNNHVLGLEDVELLKSWFVYPEKNQLRLKYEDKVSILEDEKIHGVEETAKRRNISCGTIRFWKKYPPSPEDDTADEAVAKNSNRRGIRTNDFEYVPSKFQAGKKVRRRVIIGDAVMFTQEQELQLVQWIHDHMMADNSVYTDDFRQFAKSLYSGDKSFSASSTWITKFLRRNPVLQGVNFISKYKRYFTETEKYAAVLEARRFGTSYVAKKLNSDSGLINAWKLKFAKYSVKRMAKLKQSMQLDRALPSVVTEREALPPVVRPAEIENPDMSLEEIEKEVGSGLHSYSGAIPLFEREIVQLIRDENEEKGGVTYEDISRLCRSVYEKTRPHFRASYNWTQEFIKRNEEGLGDVNILNRKKVYVDDDEPLNASTSKMYRRDKDGSDPAEVSPLLQRIMSKKPILLGQSRTLDPQNERKLVQWMVQKQHEDGYVFVDEFNEYAKSLYKGTKKFAATQAWRILFFKRNKAALKEVKLESKYRKQFTREEKMAIVAEARRLGIGHVARKLDVNSSLIYSWGFGKTPQLTQDELANKDIEQDVGRGLYSQRGTVPTIENEIVKKILEMQNQEGSVSYTDISKICIELYRETRPNFKASHNWTVEFIKRHKDKLQGVDIENMKKIYYENEDEEQPGLQSFMNTLNKNMDTTVSDSLVQIENLEHGHDIDFNAHSFEESDLNLTDLINQATANLVKQEPTDHSVANPDEMDEETSAAILERIRASKPDIVAQPKTFDMGDEKKMVLWVKERQERDGYVFTDDFVAYAKSIYKGPETFSGSQTWKKNFLRRHRKEVGSVIFRSKLVNQYTEEEREMVLEEARKFGVGYVAKQCGIDHKLIWSWKVRADQNQKNKQNAFWKGPKKATSVIAKPLNVKHTAPRPTALEPEEPLADASRGIVPEFEERIIRTIIEHQNMEGSISYEEISEISREIYQETRPNFKAGYGWIKNFLERHKNRLKNIDIENMKKLYLPDDDAIVRATGKNIREATERGATSAAIAGDTEIGEDGNTLESLQRLIARKPIVIGVPKSFNAKTEKKLVVWLQAQQAEQGYVFLDEFKEYASSLYAGDKKFAATNAWRTLFFRRNHSALKNVKIVSKFRKTFTEEEKIAIVKEAKRLGVGHVSRQLDIGHGNINVWMRELEAKGRITSGVVESPSVVSESSNSSFTNVKDKGKRKQSMERSSSTDSKHSRQSSKERFVAADEGQEEMDTGSGLYSARGIVPVFEKQIIDEVLEYYRINESIKYDDISRISQNIYKETRPSFKASHNWIKDFMSRHSERVGHLVIQNAREFLTNKEKREVLAEVDKHGLQYVSKVTNISQAQLLAWKDQLSNAVPPVPAQSPSTPVQAPPPEPFSSITPPVQNVPGVRARKYSDEEKKMYVAECEKHGISFVSSLYNVPKTNLGRWMVLFKSQNEEQELPEAPIPPEPEEEQIESKVVPMLDSNDPSDIDKVLIDWILQRNEDIGVVAVTYFLDFAQETFSDSDPGFQATEEWLTNFLTQNSARFKGIKFRYPEEVASRSLQNFTQQEKDKLCEAPEKLSKPVVEIATMAAILPHTLYDWRKNYKRKKLRESYETPIPAPAKKASGASQATKTPSPSLSKSSRSPSQSKNLSTSSPAPSQLRALLTPKSEPMDSEETEGKSKMQEKLARIENKYNAIQKQEISDEARKDGTSSVAKGRGIPLPLVLKWMKMFPETVPTVSESTPKSTKTSTPKLGSGSRSRSTESTPKSAASSPGLGSKSTEPKDTSLKVKFPAPTKTYKSRQLSTEEKKRFGMEVRAEGIAAVFNRTGIPKSTLHHWGKQAEENEALEEKRAAEGTNTQSDKSENSNSGSPEVAVKKETVDLDSFTEDQKKEIALETKSLGFEQTAKKRGIPTAVVIEWMGLYLDQSPTTSEKEFAMASASRPTAVTEKTVTPKRVYTEEEKCKIAEQALEIGPKETARVTGVHHSNVHRWMNTYKKRLKGRQYALDKKERGLSTQSKNEERHQKIQGIMRENSQSDEQNLSRSNSINSESNIGAETKGVSEFTFEDKLGVLQAADEMGVRNASVKFKVDPALIFQWRRLYDYTDASNPSAATSTVSSSSSTPGPTAKSKPSSSITTSTPKPTSSQSTTMNSSSVPNSSHSGSNQFDSIVISDDEGSCSPCSNHSWQSEDLTEESPHKRKIDFNEPDLNLSAKRSRLELNQSFGIEDEDVSSDVIDFAYTPEQKQSVVRDSDLHGLEKVSKMTNIPVSLILSWKSQFPNVASVKTEKR